MASIEYTTEMSSWTLGNATEIANRWTKCIGAGGEDLTTGGWKREYNTAIPNGDGTWEVSNKYDPSVRAAKLRARLDELEHQLACKAQGAAREEELYFEFDAIQAALAKLNRLLL